MLLLLLAPLVLAAEPVETELLRGRVLERGSGIPVEGQVRAGEQTVQLDAQGRFELPLPLGMHEVTVEADYHLHETFTVVMRAGLTSTVTWRLEPDPSTEELVVYGERRREAVAERVVSAEELRLVPGSFGDPVRALQSLPGVARPASVEGAIVVRGAEAINTVAWIDEIPVPFLFHMFVGRSIVNPALFEDVVFYPGGMPARYGGSTQALVNVRTVRDDPPPGFHGRVAADVLDFSFAGEARLSDAWSMQVGWRTAWVGAVLGVGARVWAWRQGMGSHVPPYPTLEYQDGLARATWQDGRDRVSFTALGALDAFRIRYPRGPDGQRDEPFEDLPFDASRLLDARFLRVQARWDRIEEGREQTTWLAVGPRAQQSVLQGIGLLSDGPDFGRVRGFGVFVRRRDRIPLLNGDVLLLGADLDAEPVVVEDFARIVDDEPHRTRDLRSTLAPWAEVHRQVGETWVAPGLRASLHAHDGWARFEPEPRLTVRHRLGERTHAQGFLGRFSQIPPPDRYAGAVGVGRLGVMRSWQASAGLETRFGEGLELDLTLYGSRLNRLPIDDVRVELRPQGQDPFGMEAPREGGRQELRLVPGWRLTTGTAYGLEALLRQQPRNGWHGWLALTLGRSWRHFDGLTFPSDYDAPFSLTAVGARDLPWDFRASGRLRLGSGYPYTPEYGHYNPTQGSWAGVPGSRNAERFPLFRQVDLRVDRTWTAQRARWTAYLDVHNVFNTRNPFLVSYKPDWSELHTVVWIPVIPTLGLEVAY